jgi:hypothetical protein
MKQRGQIRGRTLVALEIEERTDHDLDTALLDLAELMGLRWVGQNRDAAEAGSLSLEFLH